MQKRALLIALLAAALGFGMLLLYVHRIEADLRGQPTSVLVATQDIPESALLTRSMLAERTMPQRHVDERHVLAGHMEKVLGIRIVTPVSAGDAILVSDLAEGALGQDRVADAVPDGMRAMTVSVQPTSLTHVGAGDRIDLSWTHHGGGQLQTVWLVQNLVVSAVGSQRARRANSNTVTVVVTPRQFLALTHAEQTGTLNIALRSKSPRPDIRDDPPMTTDELMDIEPTPASRPRPRQKTQEPDGPTDVWRGR